jgi:hypothetical protein
MPPAYCVGPICIDLQQLPTPEDVRAAHEEAARAALTDETRAALTAARLTRPLLRQTIIRPG